MSSYALQGAEDAEQQAVQGVMYVAEGTVITDTQVQLHGQMVVVPAFESKLQQQLSQLKHKQKQAQAHLEQNNLTPTEDKHSSTGRGEYRFWLYPLFRSLPLQYTQAHIHRLATLTSPTSVPCSSKAATRKPKRIRTEQLYLYNNTALYNKQLAQQPVSRYHVFLRHSFMNLPPPKLSLS